MECDTRNNNHTIAVKPIRRLCGNRESTRQGHHARHPLVRNEALPHRLACASTPSAGTADVGRFFLGCAEHGISRSVGVAPSHAGLPGTLRHGAATPSAPMSALEPPASIAGEPGRSR